MSDRRTHSKNKAIIFMLTGGGLLIAALLLSVFNIFEDRRAGRVVEPIIEAIDENQTTSKTELNKNSQSGILYPDMEMPTIELDGKSYIGTLEIPTLGVILPVMKEWNSGNLKISPCRYTGSLYKDNLIIAGHNYISHFGGLKTLPLGEKIIYKDVMGNIYNYYLSYTEIIWENDVEKMEQGDWDLTLFTCTYSGKKRYVARCVRQDK